MHIDSSVCQKDKARRGEIIWVPHAWYSTSKAAGVTGERWDESIHEALEPGLGVALRVQRNFVSGE